MKVGIVVFPGSNCDHDCYEAAKATEGMTPVYVWHNDTDLSGLDAVILPGGFSYGDYLRAGAIAGFSPVMEAVCGFARRGGPVAGICNGFQVLCEVGLLPGTLLTNSNLRFICREVNIRVENTRTLLSSGTAIGDVFTMPIAHKMGNYYAEPETIRTLEDEGRVVFRYCELNGEITSEANPNGSINNIAGICDDTGRVVGMMPHPERRIRDFLGGVDGSYLFKSMAEFTVQALSL